MRLTANGFSEEVERKGLRQAQRSQVSPHFLLLSHSLVSRRVSAMASRSLSGEGWVKAVRMPCGRWIHGESMEWT